MGASCCKEESIDFSSEIELSHFHLLRSVGKGAFGKVRVVQHKKTKEIYALKYINKAKCIRMRAVENIIQERRLLEEVEFSLICNLRYAFQDDENMFMVLDLMLGGDLRFHLERVGPMKENVVRFYIAELALAINALHARRIIHRDLKPDNVLLDEHGHAHLTDFNIAVYFNPAKPLMSIAGSMAYMAPEVLSRKGYLESVDWWSLGVVMFELLFGKRPFRGKSNDILTNSILRDPLPFPDNVNDIVSPPCLDVLSKLCERDISQRLGCTSDGLDAFKKHPWFQGIDWEKLVAKEATPPFEPDSKRANFDATHELEELLMEDNPLKAKKRAQAIPGEELSAEMQLMEDKFITYDYTKVQRPYSLGRPVPSSKSLLCSGSTGHGLGHGYDQKMSLSATTLDGGALASRNSSGRLENLPEMSPAPVKAFRPDSPSDLVGQKRFNPEEDQISLISMSEASNANDNFSGYQMQQPSKVDTFLSAEAEKAALQHQDNQQQKELIEPESSALQLTSASPAVTTLDTSNQQQCPGDRLASGTASAGYENLTQPSSPSNSSGHSTFSTPPTAYNSPATQKVTGSGTALFSTPESRASLLSSVTHIGGSLMNSASIPNTPAATTIRPRILKGRQPSQSGARGAFELSSQAYNTRPMSAYTSSNTGSMHEKMLELQETKSKGLGGFSFRASISGIDEISGLGLSIGSFESVGLGFGVPRSDEKGVGEDGDPKP